MRDKISKMHKCRWWNLKTYLKRMKDLREDHDMNQEQIAEVLEISRQQYQLYESGKRKLPIDKLIELCRFYKVSADYILGIKFE